MILNNNNTFQLDELIETSKFQDLLLDFYYIKINKSFIILAKCSKDLSLDFKKLSKNLQLWNEREIKKIISMKNKNKQFFIDNWALSRIIIKKGLQVFWKKMDIKNKICSNQIMIKKGLWNKPSIEIVSSHDNFNRIIVPEISITHTIKELFIAFSLKPIGIDNELIKQHSNNFYKKIFSQQETNKFLNYFQNDYSRDIIYTIMWCLKESTLKLDGSLLIGFLPQISINIIDGVISTSIPFKSKKKYQNLITIMNNSVLVLTT